MSLKPYNHSIRQINESNTIIVGVPGMGAERVLKIVEMEYLKRAYREELKNVLSKQITTA